MEEGRARTCGYKSISWSFMEEGGCRRLTGGGSGRWHQGKQPRYPDRSCSSPFRCCGLCHIDFLPLGIRMRSYTTPIICFFFRIKILGALVSIQLIWLLAGILVYEAILRLIQDTRKVQGVWMFAVAAFGLGVNIIMAVLLGHSHDHGESSHDHSHSDGHYAYSVEYDHNQGISFTRHHSGESKEPLVKHADGAPVKKERNINVHSAYLHVLGDSIQSLRVIRRQYARLVKAKSEGRGEHTKHWQGGNIGEASSSNGEEHGQGNGLARAVLIAIGSDIMDSRKKQ